METTIILQHLTKKDKNIFNAVRFVLTALARPGDRKCYAIDCVLVEGDRFAATDGKRLHCADTGLSGLEAGLYTVLKNTQKEIILQKDDNPDNLSFPKYRDMIPTDYETYFEIPGEKFYYDQNNNIFMTYIIGELARQDIWLCSDFLQPFCVDVEWTIFFNAPDRPVLFEGNFGGDVPVFGLVMPVMGSPYEVKQKTPKKPE